MPQTPEQRRQADLRRTRGVPRQLQGHRTPVNSQTPPGSSMTIACANTPDPASLADAQQQLHLRFRQLHELQENGRRCASRTAGTSFKCKRSRSIRRGRSDGALSSAHGGDPIRSVRKAASWACRKCFEPKSAPEMASSVPCAGSTTDASPRVLSFPIGHGSAGRQRRQHLTGLGRRRRATAIDQNCSIQPMPNWWRAP